LAFISYWYKDNLDSAIGVYWVNNVPIPYVKDEAKLKQMTQFLVKKSGWIHKRINRVL